MLINYLKSFIWSTCIFISSIIILTILNYFNILNSNIIKILELFIPPISIFIGSYKIGRTTNQKGYIEGIKYGGVWITIFLIFNLITKNITIIGILYLLLIILISIFASILGINKRKAYSLSYYKCNTRDLISFVLPSFQKLSPRYPQVRLVTFILLVSLFPH